ncbi:hypothetical protein HDV05_006131 [Chytridiales sp. JEL 0842]|nr:hypothetical protein HDV05_006131 [Chytridiales sp. JEL 0842]
MPRRKNSDPLKDLADEGDRVASNVAKDPSERKSRTSSVSVEQPEDYYDGDEPNDDEDQDLNNTPLRDPQNQADAKVRRFTDDEKAILVAQYNAGIRGVRDDHATHATLAQQFNCSVSQISGWFKRREKQGAPSKPYQSKGFTEEQAALLIQHYESGVRAWLKFSDVHEQLAKRFNKDRGQVQRWFRAYHVRYGTGEGYPGKKATHQSISEAKLEDTLDIKQKKNHDEDPTKDSSHPSFDVESLLSKAVHRFTKEQKEILIAHYYAGISTRLEHSDVHNSLAKEFGCAAQQVKVWFGYYRKFLQDAEKKSRSMKPAQNESGRDVHPPIDPAQVQSSQIQTSEIVQEGPNAFGGTEMKIDTEMNPDVQPTQSRRSLRTRKQQPVKATQESSKRLRKASVKDNVEQSDKFNEGNIRQSESKATTVISDDNKGLALLLEAALDQSAEEINPSDQVHDTFENGNDDDIGEGFNGDLEHPPPSLDYPANDSLAQYYEKGIRATSEFTEQLCEIAEEVDMTYKEVYDWFHWWETKVSMRGDYNDGLDNASAAESAVMSDADVVEDTSYANENDMDVQPRSDTREMHAMAPAADDADEVVDRVASQGCSQGLDSLPNSHSSTLPSTSPSPQLTKKRNADTAFEKHFESGSYIKRPRNAFIIFRNSYQPSLLKSTSNGTLSSRDFSANLGQIWKSMSAEEREPYEELARQEREVHKKMYPDFRYHAGKKGRRRRSRSLGDE